MTSTARCIIDSSDRSVDLFYATRFACGDAMIFLEHRKKKYLILSDLEIDRAKRTATVHQVLALTKYTNALQANNIPPTAAQVVAAFCRERGIRALQIPAAMGAGHVDALRKLKLRVAIIPSPFYAARMLKTPQEIKAMLAAQRITFRAMRLAESILRESNIQRGFLQWKGKILTSERLRTELLMFLLRHAYHCPEDLIIAGGAQSIDPHERGHGPLRPHEAIIVDIFPRSNATGFFGDATRTFCRGAAPAKLKHLYASVKRAQSWGLKQVRAGADGKQIHTGIMQQFVEAGYVTGELNGRCQGFIHGTGHGLGLVIHEEPVRINKSSFILKAGHAVTIEPGLYYADIGGVRLEDIVIVTKHGATLLASYPKQLELV